MTKEFPVGLVAVIAAVAAVVVGGSVYFGLPLLRPATQDLACGGLTVNSISPGRIVSSDTDLSKLNFIVDVSASGGECVTGEMSTSLFRDKTGLESTVPLQISITSTKEQTIYPIQVDAASPVFILDSRTADATTTGGKINLDKWCTSSEVAAGDVAGWVSMEWYRYDVFGFGDHGLVCARSIPYATVGRLGTSSTSSTTTIQLTAGGETLQQTIDTRLRRTVEFSKGGALLATATWTGSEVTGEGLPPSSNYALVNKGAWLLTTASAVDTALRNYGDRWSALQGVDQRSIRAIYGDGSGRFPVIDAYIGYNWNTWGGSTLREAELGYISTTNSYIAGLLQSQSSAAFTSSAGAPLPFTIQGDEKGGQVTVTSSVKTQIPSLRFLVNAQWLGVKIPVGKPQVDAVQTTQFVEGVGVANVQVRNIGDGPGTFSASVTCGALTQLSASFAQQLPAGGTYTFPISMSRGTSTQALTDTCTAAAYDVARPSLRSEKQFSWSVEALADCVEGQQVPQGAIIYRCQGGRLVAQTTCTAGVTFDGSTYSCTSGSTGGSGGVPPQPLPQPTAPLGFQKCLKGDFKCDWTQVFGIWWFWLLVALAVVAALVAISRSRGY